MVNLREYKLYCFTFTALVERDEVVKMGQSTNFTKTFHKNILASNKEKAVAFFEEFKHTSTLHAIVIDTVEELDVHAFLMEITY